MKKTIFILTVILIFSGCTTKTASNISSNNQSQKNINNKQIEAKKNKLKIIDGEVFYDTCKQINIDINTVKEINGGYIKDKDNIYWNHRIACNLLKLENVDVNSFEALNEYFGKDNNNAYAGNKIISGADPSTFEITKLPEILDWACAKDKNRIYKHSYLTEDNNGNPINDMCEVIK